jgi:flagellar protein FlgJ
LGAAGPAGTSEAAPVTEKPATQGASDVGPRSSIASRSRDFVNRFWPHALEASKETGLPAHFILGQAALESGWGARETRAPDGAPTFNLFNIKAGQSWRGASAEVPTTEYLGGAAQKVSARFRSYGSYAEAFRDYATLLKSNGRYAGVLQSGNDPAQFARELQKAGYATDPDYAAKLTRVITGSVMRGGLSA